MLHNFFGSRALQIIGVIGLCALPGTALAQSAEAPLLNSNTKFVIPGQYIVVLKTAGAVNGQSSNIKPDSEHRDAMLRASLDAQTVTKRLGGAVTHSYSTVLVGFSAKMPAAALKAVRANPAVAFVEADQRVKGTVVQLNPPTGLDRTSERLLPLDNRYTYNAAETGTNVHAYMIDSGVNAASPEYSARLSAGVDEVMDGNGTNDCFGHGAHTTGTVGGTTYGIAKAVNLVPVRVLDCTNSGTEAGVTAGVDWVTANAVHPAVANMSLGAQAPLNVLNPAVANSIAAGITYVVAAGNNSLDACGFSPAMVPTAITVGAIDPTTDAEAGFSNFGTCVDLFAPGVHILSVGIGSPGATLYDDGTSMATPHVTGVAVHVLQLHPTWTPAQVWAAIHANDDVFPGTAGWTGTGSLGAGSPNEVLHWGSVNDGLDDGEPHLATVDGLLYNFQSAGEFVYLRDSDGLEIQTRQVPISTSAPPPDDWYSGVPACVSFNSALAVRVGAHRVTYQPNISGAPDPTGMQLRVDGVLKTLDAQGINFGGGARVVQNAGGAGAIEIDFADGTRLIAIPWYWNGDGGKWLMNVDVYGTSATEGIMGARAGNSWLPALPGGGSVGPMPAGLHQRYVALNQTFANAWRVSNGGSLFDYKPGTSTSTFTIPGWPTEGNGACVIPKTQPTKPIPVDVARRFCEAVDEKRSNANCIYDVAATGAEPFAKLYIATQRVRHGGTVTTVTDDAGAKPRQVAFTAAVALMAADATASPAGSVQFTVDGKPLGDRIGLKNGRAIYTSDDPSILRHRIGANFVPDERSIYLPSSGLDESHMVFGQ